MWQIYVNDTLVINATLFSINGTIKNCILNLSNQTGLIVIGDYNRSVGNLTNGTLSRVFGWVLNGTSPGAYNVNITSNCSDGEKTVATSVNIEVTASTSNLSVNHYA